MVTSNEASRSAKRGAFKANSQQRIELNAQIAGIAGAFGKMSEFGAPVLELQRALLAGLARSQQAEAERLARRRGKDDPSVAATTERAAAYAEVLAEVEVQAGAAGRVSETLQRDDLFSGYVFGADGKPAAGHTVRLAVQDSANKRPLRGSAKTGDDGFFRMVLGNADGNGRDPADVEVKLGRVLRAMVGDEADARPAADAAQGSPPGARAEAVNPPEAGRVISRAEVLDPSGRIVHQDPEPPTFDGVESEFRIYLLEADSSTQPKRKR